MYAWSVYKHAVIAAFCIYAQHGEDAAKGGGCHALNIHGNYIVDQGKSLKNHGSVFLNFCGNPVVLYKNVTKCSHSAASKTILHCFKCQIIKWMILMFCYS